VAVEEVDPSLLPVLVVVKKELVSICREALWMVMMVEMVHVPGSEAGSRVADMSYVIHYHQEGSQWLAID